MLPRSPDLLARKLSPEHFGLYAIAWTVVGLVGTLAPTDMPQAAPRFEVAGRKVLSSAPLLMASAIGLACSVLVWTTSSVVARLMFGDPAAAPAISAFAPSVVLLCVFQVLTSAMRGSQANVASAVVGAAIFAIYFVACVVAFLILDEPTAVTTGWMYSLALGAASAPAALILYRRPPSSATPPISTLTYFGLVTMLVHSASVLNL